MPTATHSGGPPAKRVTDLLAASVLGVYLLVVVGATTSLLDGAAACPTWPACDGRWVVPLSDPGLAAAWGHRVAALAVGLLLAATAVAAWRRPTPRRARFALGAGVALYPVQVSLGALIAVTGGPSALPAAHLVVAMALVSSLLVALLWQLEAETGTADEPAPGAPDPTPPAVPSDSPGAADAAGGSPRDDHTDTRLAAAAARARAYLSMTKPKLLWLLCLVALAAMGLAAGRRLDPGTVVATLTGGVLAVGASGTFNNVFERDADAEMERTADRPLVEERIPVRRAVAFGVVLAAASVAVFLAFVNVLAAALGVLAILFYSVVYTLLLKPNTDQNTVLGGAVGAFPALIGWAAVEDTVGVPAVVLGAVVFLWTPAHFYNLALAYEDDYERAGFPMLPVVRGAATTRRHILCYLGATLVGAVVLGATTRLGWPYAGTIVAVSAVFLWAVLRLFRERTERAAFRAFHASNAFLGGLLVAVVLDTLAI